MLLVMRIQAYVLPKTVFMTSHGKRALPPGTQERLRRRLLPAHCQRRLRCLAVIFQPEPPVMWVPATNRLHRAPAPNNDGFGLWRYLEESFTFWYSALIRGPCDQNITFKAGTCSTRHRHLLFCDMKESGCSIEIIPSPPKRRRPQQALVSLSYTLSGPFYGVYGWGWYWAP